MHLYLSNFTSLFNQTIGHDKQNFRTLKCEYFPTNLLLAYVLGAQKKRLFETILLSTHNICFGRELTKLFFDYGGL